MARQAGVPAFDFVKIDIEGAEGQVGACLPLCSSGPHCLDDISIWFQLLACICLPRKHSLHACLRSSLAAVELPAVSLAGCCSVTCSARCSAAARCLRPAGM